MRRLDCNGGCAMSRDRLRMEPALENRAALRPVLTSLISASVMWRRFRLTRVHQSRLRNPNAQNWKIRLIIRLTLLLRESLTRSTAPFDVFTLWTTNCIDPPAFVLNLIPDRTTG